MKQEGIKQERKRGNKQNKTGYEPRGYKTGKEKREPKKTGYEVLGHDRMGQTRTLENSNLKGNDRTVQDM